jgi:hypothetical protein
MWVEYFRCLGKIQSDLVGFPAASVVSVPRSLKSQLNELCFC